MWGYNYYTTWILTKKFIKKEEKAVTNLRECKYPLTDSAMCFKGSQGVITK